MHALFVQCHPYEESPISFTGREDWNEDGVLDTAHPQFWRP